MTKGWRRRYGLRHLHFITRRGLHQKAPPFKTRRTGHPKFDYKGWANCPALSESNGALYLRRKIIHQ